MKTAIFANRIDRALLILESAEAANFYGKRDLETLERIAHPLVGAKLRPRGEAITNPETGEPDRWTIGEVVEALLPRLRQMARRELSRGGRRPDPDRIDDYVQNAALDITDALRRGRDEGRLGNSFVAWAQTIARSAISGSRSQSQAERLSSSMVNQMLAATKPKDVQVLINKIPTAYRQPQSGLEQHNPANPYAEHSPELWRLGSELLQALTSKDQGLIEAAKEELQRYLDSELDVSNVIGSRGDRNVIRMPHGGPGRETFKRRHGAISAGITTTSPEGQEFERAELGGAFGPGSTESGEAIERQSSLAGLMDPGKEKTFDPFGGRAGAAFNANRGNALKKDKTNTGPDPRGAFLKMMQSPARQTMMSEILDIATDGGEGPKKSLTQQEFQVIIRRMGIKKYPRKAKRLDRTTGKPIPDPDDEGGTTHLIELARSKGITPNEDGVRTVYGELVANSVPEPGSNDPEWNGSDWSDWAKAGQPLLGTEDVGSELGVSAVRISQIQKKAFEKLAVIITDWQQEGYFDESLSVFDYALLTETLKFVKQCLFESVLAS